MDTSVVEYPIHEVFSTFQGEGLHMGVKAFFIRTFGCPLHCSWCDSAGTWHKDYKPDSVERKTASELAYDASQAQAPICVVTGGEPAIHDLSELTHALKTLRRAPRIHLETSGRFPIRGDFDFVTLSPKLAGMPLPENLDLADEIKIIVDTPDAITNWVKFIEPLRRRKLKAIWLHPEWSKREDPKILEAIIAASQILGNSGLVRVGYQLHKIYDVDRHDPRARGLAPLGGNPQLGF